MEVVPDIANGNINGAFGVVLVVVGFVEELEEFVDAHGSVEHAFDAAVFVEAYGVVDEIADQDVVAGAEQGSAGFQQVSADVMGVGAVEVEIDEFQTVFCVVIVGFAAVHEDDIAFLGIEGSAVVLNMEGTLPDEEDKGWGVGVSFFEILGGTVVVTTPGHVKI